MNNERDCEKCAYHKDGGCSRWECDGTVTEWQKEVDDFFENLIMVLDKSRAMMLANGLDENKANKFYEREVKWIEEARKFTIKIDGGK